LRHGCPGTLTAAGITAVLSGRGAVQIYSSGRYVSRDLDFVPPAMIREVEAALTPLGFRDREAIRRWSERERHTKEFEEFLRRI